MWHWLHKDIESPFTHTLTTHNSMPAATDIVDWMTSNCLKLNAEKTQFIVHRSDTQFVEPHSVSQLHSIWRSLTDEALHTLVHAYTASRVDYCNALLYGVADGVIRRLQSVLHAVTRLITSIRCYEHITPTLRDTLHWPRISQRIIFKTALVMFDCSRGRCPKYFGDLYTSSTHHYCSFAIVISRPWWDRHPTYTVDLVWLPQFPCMQTNNFNKLSLNMRSTDTRETFKRSLKGSIFECAYSRRRGW